MANQPDFDIDPDELPLHHQFKACRSLWVEVLNRYLLDCRAVWRKPEVIRPIDEYEALADLLSRDMPLLKYICSHLHDDVDAENIRTQFKRWIKNIDRVEQ